MVRATTDPVLGTRAKGSLDIKTVRGIAEFPLRNNPRCSCGRTMYRLNSETPFICAQCNEVLCSCLPLYRVVTG